MITQQLLDQAYTYTTYLELAENLLAEGKTTGPVQNEAMTAYTQMNLRRMNRLNKTMKLEPQLEEVVKNINQNQVWLVISEAWCGDAAQVLPVLNSLAEASEHIEMKIVLRDEHLDVMDKYLTNGGRAIPKLVILDAETLAELATWGPRPETLQERVMAAKKNELPYDEINKDTQLWYARDKTNTIQEELLSLLSPKLIKHNN